MKKRRELKDKPGYKNVFLNDDLTPMLSKLLYECKQMSTVDRVNTTRDGRIQCHMKKASGSTEPAKVDIVETPDDLFDLVLVLTALITQSSGWLT
ncbi:hypothetical protein BaRGS_00037173 [Batillaria attramentaria]|uniref:Uncharacterized protein n=1 Tax=Batillaria attramentaria TaxID=370345 RepID=A0ABD0J9R9_9CAEN